MRDISDLKHEGLPSGRSLIKATAGAIVVTACLPADLALMSAGFMLIGYQLAGYLAFS